MAINFLVCSERSGSNLLTKMLDAHSQICGASPVHFLRVMNDHSNRYGSLRDDAVWQTLLSDAEALFRAKTGVWLAQWPDFSFSDRDLFRMFEQMLRTETGLHGKQHVFVKENHVYRYAPAILGYWPDARFVWLVRDPRDMALSWKQAPALRGGVVRAASVWQTDQDASIRLFRQLQGLNRVLLLRYEDLVSEPAAQLRRVCDFLGVAYEEKMLSFHETPLTGHNAQRVAEWKNLQQGVMQDNFHKYRTALSEDEIRYVEAVCRDGMLQLGYRADFDSAVEQQQLHARLLPLEPYEKPQYARLPQVERDLRQQWMRVVQTISARPVVPLAG